MNKSDYKIVIPARYQSTRFPGKPLAPIDGVPMVLRVYNRVLQSTAAQVVVATDDERIEAVCGENNVPCCMTSAEHPTGTDRIAEVCAKMAWQAQDIVVNVQGDEPLIPLSCIEQVAKNLHENKDASIATLCTPITCISEFTDPNNVKVVFDCRGIAMYFSRAPIPFDRDAANDLPTAHRHIGLYAYKVGFLQRYTAMSSCDCEDIEKLEQLRAIWNGDRIHVEVARELPGMGVDTPEQLAEVEALIKASHQNT